MEEETEKKEKDEKAEKDKDGGEEKNEEDQIESKRLYVMNLSYQVTHDELKEYFCKFGDIENVEIPLRKGGGGVALGIAYIGFKDTEAAISAFAALDKSYFQGRKIHIMPAQVKPAAVPKPETTFAER